MKSIKKFSAMSAKDQPITESAKVTKEAVDELIKKIGFNSIDELKKEKDLLSKLEAMSKTFAKSNNISEDEIEEDRTEDIKDEVDTKGSPKSLEGTKDKGSDEEAAEAIADVEEEVEDEDSVEVASEEKETPKATKRIMAFEDFIKETTVNKNISYHDDDEEKEDYAVPFADSADPLAEPDEDTEMDESVVMGFNSFVNEAYDKVAEADITMSLKSLESMLKSHDWHYDKSDSNRTWDRGNRAEQMIKTTMKSLGLEGMSKEAMKLYKKYAPDGYTITLEESVTNEKFTFADAVDTAGEDVKKNEKGIASALKALNARTSSDISIMTDTTEDDGLFDAIEGMKELSIDSSIYDNAYLGKYKGKDVVVFGDGEDLFAYVKEGVGEVITKIEGDEIADEVAGADGIAIPTMKGDGSETAAGIAGDIMNKGKVKNLSTLAGKLVTTDQKVTEVIPDEANDVSEDGIEVVKEAKINEAEITSDAQFKEYATALLKKAFGADYDEAKAMGVVDGLTAKYDGDYGAMVGALQSSIG